MQMSDTHSMIECYTVDRHEVLQVVLVGCVVSVPRYHVKWRKVLKSQNKT